ncbi:unnamed protein product, partial [Ectocarpus sp. 8 AP-2014]
EGKRALLKKYCLWVTFGSVCTLRRRHLAGARLTPTSHTAAAAEAAPPAVENLACGIPAVGAGMEATAEQFVEPRPTSPRLLGSSPWGTSAAPAAAASSRGEGRDRDSPVAAAAAAVAAGRAMKDEVLGKG